MKQTIPGRTVWEKKEANLPVFFSPRGDWIGATTPKGGILLFRADDPDQEVFLPPAQPADIPFNLAWSPTSEDLLAADQLGTIEVYDLQSRRRLWTLPDHYRVEWSTDGSLLGSGSVKNFNWDLLDPATGRVLRMVRGTTALLWAPNNQVALRRSMGWFGADRLSLLDTQQGKVRAKYSRRVNDADNVSWSPDSRYVVVTGGVPVFGPPRGVWILDGQRGKVLHKLRQYVTEVRAIAWSPDSRYVALTRATPESDTRVDVVTVHEVCTGAVVCELIGPGAMVFALHWDAAGQRIRGITSPRSQLMRLEWDEPPTANGLTLWEWDVPPLGSG